MARLNCNGINCVHNESGMCGAGFILVESPSSESTSQTYCSSYEANTLVNQAKAMGNTNYIGGLMQTFSSVENMRMNPEINCHATHCFYNLYGNCEAKDIAISVDENNEFKARCQTFIE